MLDSLRDSFSPSPQGGSNAKEYSLLPVARPSGDGVDVDEIGDVDDEKIDVLLDESGETSYNASTRPISPIFARLVVLFLVLSALVLGYAVGARWFATQGERKTLELEESLSDLEKEILEWEEKDPYHKPGFMERDEKGHGIRWIPYQDSDLVNPSVNRTPSYSTAPPEYARLLNSPTRKTDPELAFLRNKTILLVGESLDRDNLYSLCAHHGKTEDIQHEWHMFASCELPDLGLTIAQWFTSGMRERDTPFFYPDDPKPESWEERLTEKFLPTLESIGNPELVILASHYWDLQFMEIREWHRNQVAGTKDPPKYKVTFEDLSWHRGRLTKFVAAMRETFPEAQIMFRLGTKRNVPTGIGEGNLGIFKLNESSKGLMRKLGIPIFNWAALIDGDTSYKDDMHFHHGQTGWLFTSMALYYLAQKIAG
ncbi:hypothetical protein T439DRAFT_330263 [Meredithblackwellia eburnea MCA 4105]